MSVSGEICLVLLSFEACMAQKIVFHNFPSHILYDITSNENIIRTDMCDSKEYSTKWQLPDNLYIQKENITDDHVWLPWDVEDMLQTMKTDIDTKLSVTFGVFLTKNQICSPRLFSQINFTAFSNLNVSSATIIVQSTEGSLEYINKEICATLCLSLIRGFHQYYDQVGIDVSQNVFECIKSSCPFVLEKVGFLIYYIELDQISSILSYGGFSRKLGVVIALWETTWKPINSGSFYVRINMNASQGFNTNSLDEVHGFVQQYIQSELNRRGNFPYVILKSSKTFETFDPSSVQTSQTLISSTTYPSINLQNFTNKTNSVCKLWHIIKSSLQDFSTFFLQVEKWEHTDIITKNCVIPPNLILNDETTIIVHGEANKSFVNHLRNKTSNMKLNIPSLLFLETKKLTIENQTLLQVISTEKFSNSESNRSVSVKIPNVILLNNTFLAQEDLSSVLSKLEDILKLRRRLEQQIDFRNVTYFLEFNITDNSVWSLTPGGKTTYFKPNLYCLEDLIKIRELHEALINWALVHEFIVSPFPVVDTYRTIGWSHAISPTLNKHFTDFETISRRNIPNYFAKSTENNMCILPMVVSFIISPLITYKYQHYKNQGVTLSLDEHLKYAVLNETHLQNFLLISFIKFGTVEVQVKNTTLLHLLMNTVTQELRGKIAKKLNRNTTDIVLYLSIDATSLSFTRANINKLLNFSPLGIHLYNWENTQVLDRITYKSIRNLNERLKNGIGIMLQDCLEEIQSDLVSLRNHELLQIAKYIVCPMIGFPMLSRQNKEKELQIFLDTQLYIREYFKLAFNKETYFRIWLNGKCVFGALDDSDGFSSFSNMLGELSNMYELNHFLGDTFLNCSHWNITNYDDLLNSSVYTNTYGQTRHPDISLFTNFPSDESSLFSNLPPIISLPLVLLSTVLIIGGVSYHYRRKAKIILSKQEIEAFRIGQEIEVTNETIGVPYVQVNVVKSLGFNKAFEVAKKYIALDRRVGAGYFGEVYKGTYKSITTVAVKQPSPDCSKEAFKTMLAEVKVLSYLGEHENVLKFIGAYTKEIDIGIIYVVTEFCENGTLEQHLKGFMKGNGSVGLTQGSKNPALSVNSENTSSMYTTMDNSDASYWESTSAVVETSGAGYTTFENVATLPSTNDQDFFGQSDGICGEPNFEELCRFAKEIASGMEYVSARKVVHSDLSTRNVLLDHNNTCKIADFGLSRKLYERTAYIKQGDEALPWRWMAVESLKNMKFTTKSDVWSYAVTLWEIFTLGDTPYPGVVWDPGFPEELEEGLRLPKPIHATEEIYEKMIMCWKPSAEERPTFSELKEFFQEFLDATNDIDSELTADS